MRTFASLTRFYAAQINGVTCGSWYVDQAKAQRQVDYLNREWAGKRTYTVHSWVQEAFTAHER
jgi:hypothetical protein